MSLAELKNKYRKISSLEKARSGWEDEYEVSSKQVEIVDEFIYLILFFLWLELFLSRIKSNILKSPILLKT
jgi:hypothetical protein